ncbi:MAG: glucuronate isomerase [Bacteroidaceae bacterium]|nr:glucuronate isomerase [Bacteroidaceae bacterium]
MSFIDKDFLLHSDVARRLFHEHSEKLPIIDYHCHIIPKQVAEDYRFRSITEVWLGGDHYKWRAMRANGVDEHFITGDATDWEKFQKWAETIPYTMRNPLYHWTHLELKTAFGIDKILKPETAEEIYHQCNEMLQQPGFTARGFMKHYHVESICTTDDPIDTLEYHEKVEKDASFDIKMYPAWRPDKAMAVNDAEAYNAYVDKLAEVADVHIDSYDTLMLALRKRHDYFATRGCNVADHGVSQFPWAACTKEESRLLFNKVRSGKELSALEVEKLQTALLLDFARMNAEKGWVQQFHFGPLRNTNSKMFKQLGPDTGFDTISEYQAGNQLAKFLDALESEGSLTKTILYNINPAENEAIAAMIANFQDGKTPGKMQFGSGWWFNDNIGGMQAQMNALSRQGLLSRFVGMLTDSRSFLSYPRHEYFRRILCDLWGSDIEKGLLPESEYDQIAKIIEGISYYNAKEYFRK